MGKVIFVRGIQGSGKSTWARNWVEEDPENRIRISWDDLRRMFGPYWIPNRESFVKSSSIGILAMAMAAKKDIVIDNMNLSEKSMEDFKIKAISGGYDIIYQDMKTPVEECIERDSKRSGTEKIGADVIMATYNRHKDFYNTPKE